MTGAEIFWLVLLVGFLVMEGACPIHLVSIWFVIGAAVALLAAALEAQIWLQTVLFFVVSGALLLAFLPWVKKSLKPKLTATNVDAVPGTSGHVTIAIDNESATGQVKLGAMEWTARSTSGEKIAEGTLVRVDRIEGVKVFVSTFEK